jgi:hypothetical protein
MTCLDNTQGAKPLCCVFGDVLYIRQCLITKYEFLPQNIVVMMGTESSFISFKCS